MTQALYRTWRPSSWEEVVGQDHIVQTLKNAVATDRVSQAYLFAGPRGTGKTTSARLLAKAVNCTAEDLKTRPCNTCENCLAINQGRFLDLIEIDAASNTSVDDVRDLRDKINFSPSQGRFKVYIIDEVHMLSSSAFNALLKTLEEPPSHVIFILATTEIHKIPATVLSRCQRHEFRRIPVPTIIERLEAICTQETLSVDAEALTLIARQATGSMRDAISLLDQLSSLEERISLAIAQDVLGTATSQAVIDLVQAIEDQSGGKGLEIIHAALDSGADPRQFARQVVEYLRALLVIKLKDDKALEILPELRATMNAHAEAIPLQQLISVVNGFSEASTDLKANWHPGLGLELAFASALSAGSAAQTVAKAPAEVEEQASQPKPQSSVEEASASAPTKKTSAKAEKEKPEPKQKEPAALKAGDAASKPAAVVAKFSMESVQENWDTIKQAVRSVDLVCHTLLNSSRVTAAHDNTLILNFSSELLKDKMMQDKPLRVLKKALKETFRQDIGVACTVGTKTSEGEGDTDFEPGGLVDRTVRELGGRVRKITPLKNDKE